MYYTLLTTDKGKQVGEGETDEQMKDEPPREVYWQGADKSSAC